MKDGFYWVKPSRYRAWLPLARSNGEWIGIPADCKVDQIQVGPRIYAPGEAELFWTTEDMLASIPFDWNSLLNNIHHSDGWYCRVYMSGSDMIDETGVAEIVTVELRDGFYRVLEYPELGEFEKENRALAAAGEHLRKKNKGKWNAATEWNTRGAEEPLATGMFAPILCPKCEVHLTKNGVSVNRHELECPKCHQRFDWSTDSSGKPDKVGHNWFEQARKAGFTEEEAELIRRLFEALQ